MVSRQRRPPIASLLLLCAGCVLLLAAACTRPATPAAPLSAAPPTRAATAANQPPLATPPTLAALAGEAQQFRFDHLAPEAGMSQSVVLDFAQDDLGFLWLATQDGLNRYDGHEFRVFKDDPQAPNSLKGNFVASIDKGPDGMLWIGTNDGGLNRYDPRTGLFTAYLHDPADPNSLSENSVSSVHVDSQGIVWAGTNNSGLNRLNPASGQITRYLNAPADPSSLSANTVSAVLAGDDGSVWVGTIGGGLNRLDPATGQFTRYRNDPDNQQSLSDDAVTSLFIDGQGVLWVGTFAGGLNRFDAATGSFTRYQNDPDDSATLAHNNVLPIFEDRHGRLWVGTQGGGLHLLDRATGRFARFQHNPLDSSSVSADYVSAIFEDSSGILWLGMFGTGADYHDPFKHKFLLLRANPADPNSLSSNSIWGILQDDQGSLWIGTNDGGLNRFDYASRQWKRYLNDPRDPSSLSSNAVYVVYQDRQGTLWLGTPAGLNRFDRQTETFQFFATPSLNAIFEDSQGNFWLGTAQGLILFDRASGTQQRPIQNDPQDPTSLSGNFVSKIFEDAQGNLWIGTLNGGLNLMDRATGRFRRFVKDPSDPTTLSSNVVLDIYQGRDGTLWIGTTGGLNKYVPGSRTFIAYRERNGLPNDFVYGILEDGRGGLWVSTNKGLARFDPQTLAFKTYDRADGLQGSEFNQWAFFQNAEGVMFFGGINGLNAFHPDLIQDNPFLPPVVITGFDIYGQPASARPDGPLPGPVETSQAVELPYTDDFFEFAYAALHFSAPEQIQYAYTMEGLDRGWNLVGNRRFASYTNVPPGDYTFRVRATNSDGVWNEHGTALHIVIPPPFWQTTWFRVLIAFGLLGAISGVFLLRIRAVEGQRRKLEVQVGERTSELRAAMVELEHSRDAAEAASRAKSTFLANMSHEFRTPLNAILGFTQIMTRDRRLPPDHRQDIEIIHRSGEHLLGLINDVLDMSKIEAGRMRLNQRGFDLVRMLEGLEEMFALRAEQKGLALSLELDPGVPHYVTADDGKLRQVLMNLLGNAVKFTDQGQVVLRVHTASPPVSHGPESSLWVRFQVEDTGSGILPEELQQIFVPFVQSSSVQSSAEGTGLGLAISQQYVQLMGGEIRVSSQPGQGSVFQFELPLEAIDVGDLEKPPPTRRVVSLAPDQPAWRLLVVDDSEVNRKLLVKIFQPVGFQVREAANGVEALAVWEAWEPHLIWLDMRMPVMDGYETTRRIKATTRGMATVIIALTASALEEDKAVILSEGCDDYMRKPFREEDLFEAVAHHLGVRYLYEEIKPETAPETSSAGDEQTLAAQLDAAEPAWLAELERAAILGDVQAIDHLAGQVAVRQPGLAATITRLARQFEHERILAAIHSPREAAP
jgi:signal transduction histidine kinase/ligand-binding sensor domain-containing protein/CheY-like chemotaxis protein